MKRMRVLSLLSALIVALPVFASAADVPEENFYPTVKQEPGWMGYNSDNSIEYAKPSSLYATEAVSGAMMPKSMYICKSLDSTDCVRP
jgi:ABC-type oligopeptide transport system substrate-binding subunit